MMRKAVTATIPVMAGYIVMGIGFGVLFTSTLGLGPLWVFCMSLFVYTGALQFLSVELLAGPAGFLTIAIQTFAVSARHLFYGLSMIDRYKGIHGLKKLYLMHALSDETYSILSTTEERDPSFFLSVAFLNQISWVFGTTLGSVLGQNLPINTEGVDFCLTALFIAIVTEQWMKTRDHVPVLIGIGSSIVSLLLLGPDRFLIPAMILIAVLLMAYRSKYERKEGNSDGRQ